MKQHVNIGALYFQKIRLCWVHVLKGETEEDFKDFSPVNSIRNRWCLCLEKWQRAEENACVCAHKCM